MRSGGEYRTDFIVEIFHDGNRESLLSILITLVKNIFCKRIERSVIKI